MDCKIAICRKISTQNTMGKSAEFGNPLVVLFSGESILTIIGDWCGEPRGNISIFDKKADVVVLLLLTLYLDFSTGQNEKSQWIRTSISNLINCGRNKALS